MSLSRLLLGGCVLHERVEFLFGAHLQVGELTCACSRWDQVAHNHILLQSEQVVLLAAHCSLVQHLGRLLEGRGRDEGFGLQRGARDALEQRTRRGWNGVAALHFGEVAANQRAVLIAHASRRHHLSHFERFRTSLVSVWTTLHVRSSSLVLT